MRRPSPEAFHAKQQAVLRILQEKGPVTAAEIEAFTGYTHGSTRAVIVTLINNGHIKYDLIKSNRFGQGGRNGFLWLYSTTPLGVSFIGAAYSPTPKKALTKEEQQEQRLVMKPRIKWHPEPSVAYTPKKWPDVRPESVQASQIKSHGQRC